MRVTKRERQKYFFGYNKKQGNREKKKIRDSVFECKMLTGNKLNDGNKRNNFATHILQVDICE